MTLESEWNSPKCPKCYDDLGTIDEESRMKHIENCEGICTSTN